VVDKRIEQSMNIVEIRMLRWMRVLTIEDRIRKEYVRHSHLDFKKLIDDFANLKYRKVFLQ